jgi:CDP-diacylglycerol---serine O-phosphatidyltransferase
MKSPAVFRSSAFRPRVRPRRPRRPLPRLKGLPITRLLPNVITTLALCSGLTAIRFAMDGRFQIAAVAVLVAALFDAMDGRVARLLNAQSTFGAELDSLSDVVSFGVAPALMLYLWTLNGAGGFGWVAALAFAVCCALRLARFNAGLTRPDLPPWAFNYFTGVPAPAGAGIVLLPMIASFAADTPFLAHPVLVVPWTLASAALMVCTAPTFSFKKLRVPHEYALPGLAGVGLFAAALAVQPWWTMTVLGLAYLATIPVSLRQYRRLAKAAADLQAQAEATQADEENENTVTTAR